MNNDQIYGNLFRCPITLQIFRHPIIASDGYTYELIALIESMKTSTLSPLIKQKLNKDIYFNKILKDIIEININENIINIEDMYPNYDPHKYLQEYIDKSINYYEDDQPCTYSDFFSSDEDDSDNERYI